MAPPLPVNFAAAARNTAPAISVLKNIIQSSAVVHRLLIFRESTDPNQDARYLACHLRA